MLEVFASVKGMYSSKEKVNEKARLFFFPFPMLYLLSIATQNNYVKPHLSQMHYPSPVSSVSLEWLGFREELTVLSITDGSALSPWFD